jgi:hypothetical protein
MKIRYIQPADNEQYFEEIIITREEAITKMKASAKFAKPDFVYESDESALEDFISIYWADVIE